MTVKITVRDTESGKLAEHAIYNQDHPWTEQEARAWVAKTEFDPWVFESVEATP
jgi:hypothetical protein